jgi:hypothetical protein
LLGIYHIYFMYFSKIPSLRLIQSGQSMTEFLVALAVLLPLFLAVSYAGRYTDIQQSAVQASRYAAFQRVMQPNPAQLSEKTIQDQMRARFFTDGKYLNKGQLRSDDTAVSLAAKGTPPLWRDLSFTPLLRSPDSVRLNYSTVSLGSGPTGKVVDGALGLMSKSAGKTYKGATVAQVEVDLLNRMDLSVPAPSMLKIAATTAAVGDSISSSGTKATRDAAAVAAPVSKLPTGLSGLMSAAFLLFEPSGPEFGCMKPDVVPGHRLEGYAPDGGCK